MRAVCVLLQRICRMLLIMVFASLHKSRFQLLTRRYKISQKQIYIIKIDRNSINMLSSSSLMLYSNTILLLIRILIMHSRGLDIRSISDNNTNTTRHSKDKSMPLQAWTGPEGSRKFRLPDYKTIGTGRLYPPGNIPGTHFC
jgi:hypothetical protein